MGKGSRGGGVVLPVQTCRLMIVQEDILDSIPISQPNLGALERKYLMDAFDSGWISSIGRYIDEFEKAFAAYCGVSHAVAVSNGTVALHLALEALGIGPGDEVVVPDLTFVSTANVVRHAGAAAVLVDVERETMCMDPVAFERAITPRTKAVIPVHLYGHPADMQRISAVAERHGIKVIEDAAEAHGAEIEGKRVGSFGYCAAFSFYGNKLITTGEGGMILAEDGDFAARLRILRDHGMSKTKKYWHTEVGYNYRMTNMQAAIGLAQVQRADELIAGRMAVIDRYRARLDGLRGVALNPCKVGCKNTYWMLCLSCDRWDEAARDGFMAEMKQRGVDTRPFFYPISDMPMYEEGAAPTPVTHELSYRGLNLPSFVGISDEAIDYICDQVKNILG